MVQGREGIDPLNPLLPALYATVGSAGAQLRGANRAIASNPQSSSNISVNVVIYVYFDLRGNNRGRLFGIKELFLEIERL